MNPRHLVLTYGGRHKSEATATGILVSTVTIKYDSSRASAFLDYTQNHPALLLAACCIHFLLWQPHFDNVINITYITAICTHLFKHIKTINLFESVQFIKKITWAHISWAGPTAHDQPARNIHLHKQRHLKISEWFLSLHSAEPDRTDQTTVTCQTYKRAWGTCPALGVGLGLFRKCDEANLISHGSISMHCWWKYSARSNNVMFITWHEKNNIMVTWSQDLQAGCLEEKKKSQVCHCFLQRAMTSKFKLIFTMLKCSAATGLAQRMLAVIFPWCLISHQCQQTFVGHHLQRFQQADIYCWVRNMTF